MTADNRCHCTLGGDCPKHGPGLTWVEWSLFIIVAIACMVRW
ncbi:MAG TPA: hypothetical protein VF377_08990 [Acidimicrobiia bacterium]